MRKFIIFLLTITIVLSTTVTAKTIEGVEIPDTVTLPNNVALQLNGAGIRSKFFFDIYIGALYLIEKTHDVDQIINDLNANRVLMHFLYKEVSKKKLTDGWTDGFEVNLSKDAFAALKARLEKFNALFKSVKKSDVIHLDYIPAQGTEVYINNALVGNIEGKDFNAALLNVWLGKKPADGGLKKAMLGE